MNGLAAIAIIKQDFPQAVSLYKEALAFAEEHSEDFRLDPLLNIHIHHNLGEILPLTSNSVQQVQTNVQFSQSSKDNVRMCDVEECDQHAPKRTRVSREETSDLTNDYGNLPSERLANGLCGDQNCEVSTSDQCLRLACENLKHKFLSVFNTKISVAQQDFRKSYGQVCSLQIVSQHITNWLFKSCDTL